MSRNPKIILEVTPKFITQEVQGEYEEIVTMLAAGINSVAASIASETKSGDLDEAEFLGDLFHQVLFNAIHPPLEEVDDERN